MDEIYVLIRARLKYSDILTLTRDAIKSSHASYKASQYINGYHPFYAEGRLIYPAQRNTATRMGHIDLNFNGLRVLDLGCNQGGMLREVAAKIKQGVGMDYNRKLINVANLARRIAGYDNLEYYTFDLEMDDPEIIQAILPGEIDVCFFLSMCIWVKSWPRWIAWISKHSRHLILETNGSETQQHEQITVAKKYFKSMKLLSQFSDDDPRMKHRSLYRFSN